MNLAILPIACEANIKINIKGYIYCNGSINNMKKWKVLLFKMRTSVFKENSGNYLIHQF